MGVQYPPSLDEIEIDITFMCNLKCFNCDRSCTQAVSNEHMEVSKIEDFIKESVEKNKKWNRIRILGGEPLIHPQVEEIVDLLREYKEQRNKEVKLELVTNGFGEKVQRMIEILSPKIYIKNTNKTERFQEKFEPFNMAPVDNKRNILTDYKNACWITSYCGIGMNVNGYYQCAVAGGIDRVMKKNEGLKEYPKSTKELEKQMIDICKY